MDQLEIEKELKLPYNDLCKYLQEKYGMSEYDYFANQDCKSKNKKVARTSEGLYCHHADEDKGGNLSNPPQARMQPYAWQKKERLVYCNAIEHLILHMKIAVLRHNRLMKEPKDTASFFTTGGIYMVCSEINDLFSNKGTSLSWKQRCYEEFKDNYDDYIHLVQGLIQYIDQSYFGQKSQDKFLNRGSLVHFSNCDCKILSIKKDRTALLLLMPNGEEKAFTIAVAYEQMTYADFQDNNFREMAVGYKTFYDDIYSDFINVREYDLISKYANYLSVDYSEELFEWGSKAVQKEIDNNM